MNPGSVAIYQDPKNFFPQMPVVPEEFLDMFPEFLLPEQKQAWLQTRTGAIVGRKTAERFHWKIGDKDPDSVLDLGEDRWQPPLGVRHRRHL